MFYLKLFGSPALQAGDRPLTGRAVQRHRVAMLALLALSPGRRMSRDKLLGYLWPERDTENARNLLKVATHVLRTELDNSALVSDNDELRLSDDVVSTDVVQFEAAIKSAEFARAVELYQGPLLDGFFLNDSPEFEQWLDQQRTRLANDFARALESLAVAAEGGRDFQRAVEWWQRRAALDPLDSRVAIRLILALDASGSRVLALKQAAVHEHLLREEFGIEPPAELGEVVERLRAEPVVVPRKSEAAEVDYAAPAASVVQIPERKQRAFPRVAVAAALVLVVAGAVFALAALRSPVPTNARALAVLPFVNMSADGGHDYFSDGLTEQIISVLSRIPELRVAARTSSFALRDSKLDIRAIGDTLNVNVVLEGSVRRDGNRLRVTAQLIDANTGYHIWSGDYDREMRQILEVQDEVAADIAHALELRMPKRAEPADRAPPNLQAYDLYLRALYLRDTFTPEALSQARRLLDRAVELDPDFALAYAHKATVLGPALYWQHVPLDAGVAEARAAVKRALALDPNLGDAYGALGMIEMFFDWNFPAAERALKRAVALNPNDYHAWHQLANYNRAMGRPPEAARARAQAVALDPLNVRMGMMLAHDLAESGRYDESSAQFDRILRLDPSHPMIMGVAPDLPAGPWVIYLLQGKHAQVVAEYLRMASVRGATAGELDEMRNAFQQHGMPAFWRSFLAFDLRHAGPVPQPVRIATFHALAGDNDQAMEWLERGFATRNPAMMYVPADRDFAALRSNPRFQRIVKGMNYPAALKD